MDKILMEKIEQKIHETVSNKEEILQLIKSLSSIDDSKSFALGITVGRIYNAFYYQTKRILGRTPTESEFKEFVEFVKSKKYVLE